jgi:hypothetical protein
VTGKNVKSKRRKRRRRRRRRRREHGKKWRDIDHSYVISACI